MDGPLTEIGHLGSNWQTPFLRGPPFCTHTLKCDPQCYITGSRTGNGVTPCRSGDSVSGQINNTWRDIFSESFE
ncbi:hypothetical protein EYF80_066768 [Liparis tanakae]|uniref:Uncharacterized protein n=1 Tax=Liparis tanakae TaxID=230148 RepID=A0A4Z2E386_9TELE|nr:hypothetical protein EYF80_066768 [Liparis tanakae]